MTMHGYKAFTHDLRPPVQGGRPVWDGRVPYVLPTVAVNMSDTDCGAGWNFCRAGSTALRIAGLWPDGRPVRLFAVEAAAAAVVERGEKCRAPTLTILAEVPDLRPHVEQLSQAFDGAVRAEMVEEQLAWHHALGRPGPRDEAAIVCGLTAALAARGLAGWTLRQFDSVEAAGAAGAARNAWDAEAARNAWAAGAAGAARNAWDAGDARNAWAARAARNAGDAGAARAARNAGDARNAWAAWAALTVYYAAWLGWLTVDPKLLTTGIREAYAHGLEVAVPVATNTLRWV